jgi:hypothetical protein
MATTPNFNWSTPDNTGLVKNGALDIRTLGNSIDASMAELKGGTTGQVLSKTSATDMDFTWIAPASGASYVAGKNGIINSAFDVWQRTTSATFSQPLSYPAADRWYGISLGAGPTCTMSRQTADTTGLTYGMRFGRNSGQTGIGDIYVGNTFESIDTKRFAGQTVTLSFYVKAGANAPSTLTSQIRTGTGTDQSSASLFSTGWTGGANNSQNNTVTTTMTRYTQTVTLGSTVNQIMIAFSYTPSGTAGANEWFQIEGVQFEIASAASAFSRNAPTQSLEVAACQRYYWRSSGGDLYSHHGLGITKGGTSAMIDIKLPVTMRVKPTTVDYSTLAAYNSVSIFPVTSLTFQNSQPSADTACLDVGFSAGGGTQYAAIFLVNNNSTSGYVGIGAEL